MGGILAIATAICGKLLVRLPWQNKKQREGLASLIATALQVRSVNLNELAAALPRAAERLDMRYQWISPSLFQAVHSVASHLYQIVFLKQTSSYIRLEGIRLSIGQQPVGLKNARNSNSEAWSAHIIEQLA